MPVPLAGASPVGAGGTARIGMAISFCDRQMHPREVTMMPYESPAKAQRVEEGYRLKVSTANEQAQEMQPLFGPEQSSDLPYTW